MLLRLPHSPLEARRGALVLHILYILNCVLFVTMEQSVQAALSPQEAKAIAQRFRPYIKTTLFGGFGESFHPCNWQWFVAHCDLQDSSGNTILTAQQMAAD